MFRLECYAPKLHNRHAGRNGGLRIYLHHLRVFNIHRNADTRELSFFAAFTKKKKQGTRKDATDGLLFQPLYHTPSSSKWALPLNTDALPGRFTRGTANSLGNKRASSCSAAQRLTASKLPRTGAGNSKEFDYGEFKRNSFLPIGSLPLARYLKTMRSLIPASKFKAFLRTYIVKESK